MCGAMIDLKIQVMGRGRSLKQLAAAARINYAKLIRVVNGFDKEPVDFGCKVRRAIADWDTADRIARDRIRGPVSNRTSTESTTGSRNRTGTN